MARFPDVRVDLPVGFDADGFGGKALRARTRLALESAGHVDESLEYLDTTKHLLGAEQRAELLRITEQWVTADRTTASPATTVPVPAARTRTARSTPADRVRMLARPVEIGAWVLMPLVVVGSLAIALRDDPVCSLSGIDCSTAERYPDLPLGLFLGLVGLVMSAAVALVAAYIRTTTDHRPE